MQHAEHSDDLTKNITEVANSQQQYLPPHIQKLIADFQKKYLTPKETSQFIGAAVQTLAKWRSQGGVGPPFIRMGNRRIMYATDDLVAWMNSRRVRNTSETIKAASEKDRGA